MEAKILSGASQSNALTIGSRTLLVQVAMPAAWDAANLTFLGSFNDVGDDSFLPIQDLTAEATVTAAAGKVINLKPEWFRGFQRIKIRSGTAASAVTQNADRILDVRAW